NLKWGSYSNITIKNSSILNSGVSSTAAPHSDASAAVTIKARDDAPSYDEPAATLTDVTFINNTVSGPEGGLRFGEFGKTNASPVSPTVTGNTFEGVFNHKTFINNISRTTLTLEDIHANNSFEEGAVIVRSGSGDPVLQEIFSSIQGAIDAAAP